MSAVLSGWHSLHLALLVGVVVIAGALLSFYLLNRNSIYKRSKGREVNTSR